MASKLTLHPARKGGRTTLVLLAALAVILPCPRAMAQSGFDLHGCLSTKYRLRAAADQSDQDIHQYLDLNVGDPLKDKVTAHLFARATLDLEGKRGGDGYYVFDSITDTHDQSYNARLYYAYLDINRVEKLDVLRLGRQLIRDAPVTLYFDGVRVETAENKGLYNLKLGVYGGAPVHLYENDPAGNSIFGAFVQTRPWQGSRIQLHYTRVENEYIYGREKDDFLALSCWQSIQDKLLLNLTYTRLDNESRDLAARAAYYNPERDLIVRVSYYELLESEKMYSIDFDPFFHPLQEQHPYWQAGLLVYKGIGENYGVDAGLDGRGLKDSNDEGLYNHEFLRYFVTLHARDLAMDGLQASVTGEVWDSYTREDQVQTYAADLTYQAGKKTRVSVGTDYSLYRYDFYTDTEREQVRTYYAKLRYRPVEKLRLDMSYSYEDDDFDDFLWFEIAATYEFGKNHEQ